MASMATSVGNEHSVTRQSVADITLINQNLSLLCDMSEGVCGEVHRVVRTSHTCVSYILLVNTRRIRCDPSS